MAQPIALLSLGGINDVDPDTMPLVQRVIGVSTIMAILLTAQTLYNSVTWALSGFWLFWRFFVLGLYLAVPACGYFGAKNRSKDLLKWYAGCNGCSLLWTVFSLISFVNLCNEISEENETDGSECSGVSNAYFFAMCGITMMLNAAALYFGSELVSRKEVSQECIG